MALHHPVQPLDLLCACISAGHECRALDGASAAALVAPSADLVGLARLAGRHLVTPMLAPCITDSQLRARLPEDFALYLDFIHAENTRRNRALRRQLGHVAACLNRIGIEPVLLKGAIRLVDGLYRDPGWRFMRDLDLLVARERLSEAVACLKSAGYAFTGAAAAWPEQHRHLPPLGCEGEAAIVEIHADLLPDRRELCPAQEVLARSRPVDLDGARVRVPDTADQLAHLLGHDCLDGYLRRSGTFLLRSVFETALLCRDEHSVTQLLARARAAGLARCAQVRLQLIAWLFRGYVSPAPAADLGGRLQAGALMAAERFDQSGRIRRLIWFGGLLPGKLLTSPTERAHLRANFLSPAYHRRSAERLRYHWTNH